MGRVEFWKESNRWVKKKTKKTDIETETIKIELKTNQIEKNGKENRIQWNLVVISVWFSVLAKK